MRCSSPWSWSSCRPYFHHPDTTPPGYTVKIVDNIPAGDLGTHLPRLTQDQPHPEHRTEPPKPAVEQHKPPPPPTAPDNDKTVIALNMGYTPTPDADAATDARAHRRADARAHRRADTGAHARTDTRAHAETDSPAPADA